MTENVDDFLAHFGVKGMHWGSHLSGTERATSGSRTRATAPTTKASNRKPLSVAKPAKKSIFDRIGEAHAAKVPPRKLAPLKSAVPRNISTPTRPKAVDSNSSAGDQVIQRLMNNRYHERVQPALDHYVANIPHFDRTKNTAAVDIIDRLNKQNLNAIENSRGAQFMAGVPDRYKA